jgi:hypothetical protein
VIGALYSLFRFVAKWIPGWLFRVKTVCVMELHRKNWKLPTDTSGIRWAGADDVERLEDLSRRRPGGQARLARGGRALIGVDGDRILGCMWFEPSAPLYEKWLQLVVGDSERWISDICCAGP